MGKSKSVKGSVEWCYICGWPIPDYIASSKHPLYGTIDHVLPRAKGGANSRANRRAAHLYCNRVKADSFIRNVDRQAIHYQVRAMLARLSHKTSRDEKRRAKDICFYVPPAPKIKARLGDAIMNWEDDGGALYGR